MTVDTQLPVPVATRRRRGSRERETPARSVISPADLRRPGVRIGVRVTQGVLLLLVALAGIGPLWWLIKGALSGTQELLRNPAAFWPAVTQWSNLGNAWTQLDIGHYLLNTVVYAVGAALTQVLVAVTAGFALSVLRPRFGPVVYGAILATLFVPGTVSLVALYLTIIDLPGLHVNIANTPWAIWLPAGAHAFNVLIAKQFFDTLPRELFEAASVDGASSLRMLWQIAMPLSRPMMFAIGLLSLIGAWKDFIWPLIAMSDPTKQPLSVALPRLAQNADQALLLAGMLISTIPPLIVFIVFQRQVVQGVGFSGLKG
ncbi:multiple sugar transport system permease protein [Microbacterium azadirachtae]|nr:multiple sugar transport system permease protein [Microbacterium azadirachtae]SEF94591.1 multiple sugar transport system permease protein [Microbacterium azadirachtae]SEF97207.1 multiple sugar transport system permease protein [Microbacterium azadirachtae]